MADESAAGSVAAVPVACLLRLVQAEYGQRQDAVGPGNPHGEHAHEVWHVSWGE